MVFYLILELRLNLKLNKIEINIKLVIKWTFEYLRWNFK
jgi:hypothetical protein